MDEKMIPADVPENSKELFLKSYEEATKGSGRLMLFAGDQKVEHLNGDFYGEGIHEDDGDPEHLFKIASGSKIGVFATQLGLIVKYGKEYPDLPYLVKINSKTNLVKTEQKDPLSSALWNVNQVVGLRNNGVNIVGVGYTVYIGSEFENIMLREAAKLINEAHKNGLIVVLWLYPRGKTVKDEKDPHLIAGATGIAACLGADFVKVNPPKKEGENSTDLLKEITRAAGRTKVVCAGGSSVDPNEFFQRLHDQIHIGGVQGNATGRNIHQKSLKEAINMCNAIFALTVEDKTVEEAAKIYNGE